VGQAERSPTNCAENTWWGFVPLDPRCFPQQKLRSFRTGGARGVPGRAAALARPPAEMDAISRPCLSWPGAVPLGESSTMFALSMQYFW
jgi:hypothetical protein